jgi:hypothetical protein
LIRIGIELDAAKAAERLADGIAPPAPGGRNKIPVVCALCVQTAARPQKNNAKGVSI